MRLPRSAFLILACAGLAGCPDKSTPGADAGTEVALQDAGPPALTLRLTGEVPDAGTVELPAHGDGRAEIPALSALVVRTNVPLQNYRVRVFDEVDRAMVSDDLATDEPDGTVYRISFPTPLKAGHKYVLSIDAQTGPELTDSLGRTHPDVRLEFQVAGEKEKPPPPAPKKKRRRK